MYFEQKGIRIADTSDAKKEKIDREKAWELIVSRQTVHIGKGKKVLCFEPDALHREEILIAAMGRSGNLRAPAVMTKDALFIGYNELIYGAL
ncbi:MAG: hypothetical protein KKF12_19570 [Proteobacteria bacterium]|nr:hypothetical protein [Desulfobacula sp.]MBU3954556.1 hypothetical protein [Pseudomonadota bacterium]MBU4133024.1 hypothetical protein [Pseudomonadota bacterium]